jgi:ribonuclease BN (tRNA processing enzyme)
VHLTAEEAGQLAAKANVGRLMLTHIWPQLDPKVSIEQAKRHFSGEVLTANDHLSVEI